MHKVERLEDGYDMVAEMRAEYLRQLLNEQPHLATNVIHSRVAAAEEAGELGEHHSQFIEGKPFTFFSK